jgi:hypothetical protein
MSNHSTRVMWFVSACVAAAAVQLTQAKQSTKGLGSEHETIKRLEGCGWWAQHTAGGNLAVVLTC